MRMIFPNVAALLAIALLAASLAHAAFWGDLARWVVAEQRVLQNDMALAVRAIRAGDIWAWFPLMAAAGTYGFVHAIGPGHGKFLIAGVGLASPVSGARLGGVALASSLAQAAWAIVLVYGGFWLLEASAAELIGLSERYLAPASHGAIAAIGALLALRGLHALWRSSDGSASHAHQSCGCGGHGGHGPSTAEITRLASFRDTVALVFSIAIRPCTGALFLLVIAWQMDIAAAGAAAVMVMGLGTATTTGLVAVSSVAARALTRTASQRLGVLAVTLPALQLVSGLAVTWFASVFLRTGMA
ncbi:MAG: hypothetical protein AAF577_15200 [Pseudomonadota bacterium]